MPDDYFTALLDVLRKRGIEVDSGLTEAEFRAIEALHGFRFPPDLRALLATGVPTSRAFPNWRDDDGENLRWILDAPIDGIVFDVETNDFWMDEWGARPESVEEAAAVARARVTEAPTLIPVFSHRYIPDAPHSTGNPVFSVVQTDIVCYGNDIPGYFETEFEIPRPPWARSTPRAIQFWSHLLGS